MLQFIKNNISLSFLRPALLYKQSLKSRSSLSNFHPSFTPPSDIFQTQQFYYSLFEQHPDAVYLLNEDGKFLNINSSAEHITLYSKEEFLQLSFDKLVEKTYQDLTRQHFQKALAGNPQHYETVLQRKDGQKVPVFITNMPIKVKNKIVGVCGIARDISREKETINLIQTTAYTDRLTGLPNRSFLYEQLIQFLEKTNDINKPIAVLLVDIDHFEKVNDLYGHHTGDLLLKEVAAQLKSALRSNDFLLRHGDDEFIIILDNVTKKQVEQVAQRLLQKMNASVFLQGYELVSTLSIGISSQQDSVVSTDALIKQADLARYAAKETGKNNYQFYTNTLHKKTTRKRQLEAALYKAIEQQELQLYYQPQFYLPTGKLTGMEALLRWNSPFGPISPEEFIPIAEETGLIVPIGEWVIKEACDQLHEWMYTDIKMAVNVSSRQFKEPHFVNSVKRILQEKQVDPHRFEIEITESLMLDVDHAQSLIQELRNHGITIAIDDFGTGYSSLHLLMNLNFDTLKIDRSFLALHQEIGFEKKLSLLKAMLDLTVPQKNMIIEGIETNGQLDALRNFKMMGQGYLFSPPLPPEKLKFPVSKN